MAALELAALADHAQRAPHARLLLLRREAGFYAVPGTESQPLTVGPVALAAVADARDGDEERHERTARRFQLHAELPLIVCCTPPPSPERIDQLRELVGEHADVEFADFETRSEDMAR